MGGLNIQLFGEFAIFEDGRGEINPPAKKAQALLAYLALNPDRRQTRDKLATLLWGDRFDEQARRSLRQCLLAMRKGLGADGSSVVVADGDALALGTVEVDVRRFERLAAGQARDTLEEAVAIYRGDLLEGLAVNSDEFEGWLESERVRLRELAADVLGRLVTLHEQAGEFGSAIEFAQRELASIPCARRPIAH